MAWKYALRECRMHVVMSVLCLVQAVFLFAIVIGLLSIFMVRYSVYQPVQKLMEQKGFICNMEGGSVHLDGKAEGLSVQNSESYEKMLKDAKVYGQYEVGAFAGKNAEITKLRKKGSYFSNVRAYDDAWIKGFAPKMQSGRWLKQENAEGKQLEAVVLQSSDKYKTGDTVYLDNNSLTELHTKIPIKIVGIIDRTSNIIYQSSQKNAMDYHLLFSNMAEETERMDEISYTFSVNNFLPETFFVSKKNLDCVQEQYADQESEKNLSKNYEGVLHTEKIIFQTELNGVVLVTMDRDCSQEKILYNKNRIAQISQFHFLHDLDYVKKNTWQNILSNISDMIPIGCGMILFTLISFVTLSTLMYLKNIRKYSIYYMNGLTWWDIFRIHVRYIIMIILAALLLGIALIYGAERLGILKSAAVEMGVVQIGGCLLVILLLLGSASLACLSLVKGRSAKEILQEVE